MERPADDGAWPDAFAVQMMLHHEPFRRMLLHQLKMDAAVFGHLPHDLRSDPEFLAELAESDPNQLR
jgi:hypothetical protein